jgi:hypothetical protein
MRQFLAGGSDFSIIWSRIDDPISIHDLNIFAVLLEDAKGDLIKS